LWQIHSVTLALVFVFGLIIGSFLNVCIVRLPKGESVVRPASHCPACQAPIKPYDNVPLLSYLLLRGRCRACRAPISALYPMVELVTGLMFAACYWRYGLSGEALKWAAFAAILIVLVCTDVRDRILPDAVNFLGLGAGLAFSFLMSPGDGTARWLATRLFAFPPPDRALSVVDSLLGATFGGGLLWLVAEGYFWLRRRPGMGFGDVKMMAMVGSFLGVRKTFLTILIGSLIGSLLGFAIIGSLFLLGWRREVAARAHRRGLGHEMKLRCVLASRYQLPFGTYLGIAALAALFFGTPVLDWYQSLWAVR
jgi:leader peptidase (prepilin peptidase)/N-methyltransferase